MPPVLSVISGNQLQSTSGRRAPNVLTDIVAAQVPGGAQSRTGLAQENRAVTIAADQAKSQRKQQNVANILQGVGAGAQIANTSGNLFQQPTQASAEATTTPTTTGEVPGAQTPLPPQPHTPTVTEQAAPALGSAAGGAIGAAVGGPFAPITAVLGSVLGGVAGKALADCIIVTACAENEADIDMTRRFRDRFLSDESKRGYYLLADGVASHMEDDPDYRRSVRANLVEPLLRYGAFLLGETDVPPSQKDAAIANGFLTLIEALGARMEPYTRVTGEIV